MGSAREEILGRIRAAGSTAAPSVTRDYERLRHVDDPAGLLAERIADYRATVYRTTAEDLPHRIAERLEGRGRIVTARDIPEDWRVRDVPWLFDDPPLDVSDMEDSGGVLSGCALAIAETGTIVLDAGCAQGRRMLTLVPDYHLCVVRSEQIVVSVPEAIAALDPLAPLTFISGPSATSDIELDRVEGVHGPRTLDVLLVG